VNIRVDRFWIWRFGAGSGNFFAERCFLEFADLSFSGVAEPFLYTLVITVYAGQGLLNMNQNEARDAGRSGNQNHDIDSELEDLIEQRKAEIKVVGSGGAGNNTISRLVDVGIEGCETIAMNTDAQDLLYANADKKVLIGKELTGGLGAGADPKVGEESAKESQQKVKSSIEGADMVFITCGLGGGTGTGSAPVIAEQAKKQDALTVGIVTLPFEMEGQSRQENAEYGLERLEEVVDTLIVIPNDKLLEIVPDEILVNAVK
jgi:cell division protein FtsZ